VVAVVQERLVVMECLHRVQPLVVEMEALV
jgi:hypothetical protein